MDFPRRRRYNIIALLFCVGSPVVALADNCSGTYHNVAQSGEVKDLGNGVKLITFTAASSTAWHETGDLFAGTCTGYVIAKPDGSSKMVYTCARKNAVGDVLVDEGGVEPGADKGSWKFIVATGGATKYLGSSGWWQSKMDDGKVAVGTFGGSCK